MRLKNLQYDPIQPGPYLKKKKKKKALKKKLDSFCPTQFQKLKYPVNNREDTRACHASGFCKTPSELDVGKERAPGRGQRACHTWRGLSSTAVSENDQLGNCSGAPKGENTFI